MSYHVLSRVLIGLGLIAVIGTALVYVATPLVRSAVSTDVDRRAAAPAPTVGLETKSDPVTPRVATAPAAEPAPAPAPAPPVELVRQPASAAPDEPTETSAVTLPTTYIPTPPAPAAPAVGRAPADDAKAPGASAPRAVGLVDINSASAEELNRLGGGRVGRAIIRGRPYRSVEDLVSKRILNRTTFGKIRTRITAR
jgi:DNA uptake protein ComE-like DNA-binding protein